MSKKKRRNYRVYSIPLTRVLVYSSTTAQYCGTTVHWIKIRLSTVNDNIERIYLFINFFLFVSFYSRGLCPLLGRNNTSWGCDRHFTSSQITLTNTGTPGLRVKPIGLGRPQRTVRRGESGLRVSGGTPRTMSASST